jgi:hypothetical protein
LESISDTVEFSVTDNEPLITTAMTTLSSKIINVHKRQMAEVCVLLYVYNNTIKQWFVHAAACITVHCVYV